MSVSAYVEAMNTVNRVLMDAQLARPLFEVPPERDLQTERAAIADALEAFEALGIGVLFYMLAVDARGQEIETITPRFVLRFTKFEAAASIHRQDGMLSVTCPPGARAGAPIQVEHDYKHYHHLMASESNHHQSSSSSRG